MCNYLPKGEGKDKKKIKIFVAVLDLERL